MNKIIGSNFIFNMLEKYQDNSIVCLDKLTYAGNLSTLIPIMEDPGIFLQTNFKGTTTLMDVCRKYGSRGRIRTASDMEGCCLSISEGSRTVVI